jgi:hypothetical protein
VCLVDVRSHVDDFGKATLTHGELCRCHACLASFFGKWIDGIAGETLTGRWQTFGTVTFRTPNYPWQKGFPMGGSYKPSPHFVHRTYEQLIRFLESELKSPVDYVVADQLGAVNGRLHQHFILAAPGLDELPRNKVWNHLFERAGFNRILPFEQGAAYYIGRYIGRAVTDCEWDLRLASHPQLPPVPCITGKVDLVPSAEMPKEAYKNTKKGWHR